MNKYFIAVLISLGLTSCAPKNEAYYQSHVNELQQAVKACPKQTRQGLSCHELQVLAKRMDLLAYQLQLSPQGFGKNIMRLQKNIAHKEEQIKTQGNNASLQTEFTQEKRELADHLAVVRWLESPTS